MSVRHRKGYCVSEDTKVPVVPPIDFSVFGYECD